MKNAEPTTLTKREAAEWLRVSTRTIERYVATGVLPQRSTPGGHGRYLAADVDRLLEKGLEPQAPFVPDWVRSVASSLSSRETADARTEAARAWAKKMLAKPPRRRRQAPKE